MISSIRSIVLTIVTLVSLCSMVTGQQEPPQQRFRLNKIFSEHFFISLDSNRVSTTILFRIRYDCFVFSKTDNSSRIPFTARGEISIEILDSTDLSIARQIRSVQLSSTDNSIAFLKERDYQGLSEFNLKPGTYSLVLRIEDKESREIFDDTKKEFLVPSFSPTSLLHSNAVFLYDPLEQARTTSTVINTGGGTEFGKRAYAAMVVAKSPASNELRFSLRHLRKEGDEDERTKIDSTITATLHNACRPSFEAIGDSLITLQLSPDECHSVLLFEIPNPMLKQGRYRMKAALQSSPSDSLEQDFEARWLLMPSSLSDLDLAIEVLKYVATEEEYKELRRGTRGSRIKKFEDFWKPRDPTPQTAYNEMMAEYYRRVDQAIILFRTVKEENGTATDRGKVYILLGKPSRIDRILAPNQPPRERWFYDKLKRQYLFEDPSRQGNYQLISSESQ